MKKKMSIFYSKKFLIFNVALVSVILGFVLSTVLIYSYYDNNTGTRIPTAYAQDTGSSELGISALESMQYSFRNVAEVSLPVVVEINVIEVIKQNFPQFNSPFDFFFDGETDDESRQEYEYKQPGLGSGIIVEKQGNKVYVLTNNHVVGKADEISIRLYDGREFEAKIIGKDVRTDLALVMFETADEVPLAILGDSDSLHVGDWAIAVGNPLGFESTVTVGIISALARKAIGASQIANFTDYIQTDADINPGNSGGALLNIRGEIIGINTWIATSTGRSVGLGFAIPINNAKKVINDFISKGRVEYGWVGVQIGDTNPNQYPGIFEDLNIVEKNGAFVLNVFEDSPAEKAGLLAGDLITKVNEVNIKDSNHLTSIVGNILPGKVVEFTLLRFGKEKKINIKLVVREEEEKVLSNSNVWPGMVIIGINDQLIKQLELPEDIAGVLVANTAPKSPSGLAGLREGDVIVKINDKTIKNAVDFYGAINDKSKNDIIFRVYRQGREIILGVAR